MRVWHPLLLISTLSISAYSQDLPWYFEPNGVEWCWERHMKGDGVRVHLLDSPIVVPEALQGKVLKGLIHGTQEDLPAYAAGHATAMASLIVSDLCTLEDEQDSNRKLTIAGIAPAAKILSYGSYKSRRAFVDSFRSAHADIEEARNARGKKLTPTEEDASHPVVAVMSVSGGFSTPDFELTEFLRDLEEKDILIVAAVGNMGHKIDRDNVFKNGIFPAARKRPSNSVQDPILRVAALARYSNQSKAELYKNSNFGKDYTDISAPGVATVLTVANKARQAVGTSEAAAITSGALALLISCNPYAQRANLRSTLLITAYKNSRLADKVLDGNILCIKCALKNYCFDPPTDKDNIAMPVRSDFRKTLVAIVLVVAAGYMQWFCHHRHPFMNARR